MADNLPRNPVGLPVEGDPGKRTRLLSLQLSLRKLPRKHFGCWSSICMESKPQLTRSVCMGLRVHLAALRRLHDPNDLECMTLLQALAEVAPKAADALLAFATGNSATRELVLAL